LYFAESLLKIAAELFLDVPPKYLDAIVEDCSVARIRCADIQIATDHRGTGFLQCR
jgi:hypothetical protein